jgi:hypothetical protein
MGFMALVPRECRIISVLGEEYLPDGDIEAKEGCDVTGFWDKASLYTLWTGVSFGTGLFCDMVVASAVSKHVF